MSRNNWTVSVLIHSWISVRKWSCESVISSCNIMTFRVRLIESVYTVVVVEFLSIWPMNCSHEWFNSMKVPSDNDSEVQGIETLLLAITHQELLPFMNHLFAHSSWNRTNDPCVWYQQQHSFIPDKVNASFLRVFKTIWHTFFYYKMISSWPHEYNLFASQTHT